MARFDTLTAFDAFWDRQYAGDTGGGWKIDAGGSTPTSSTGPGSNSAGPYAHSETTGAANLQTVSDRSDIRIRPDVDGWSATDRILRLRLAIAGAGWTQLGEGVEITGRAAAGGDWMFIAILRGWPHLDTYRQGDTITDRAGYDHVCAQDGGWVDFALAIPDDHTQLRLRLKTDGPHAPHLHDVGLWSADVVSRVTAAADAITAGAATLTAAAGRGAGATAAVSAGAAVLTADAAHIFPPAPSAPLGPPPQRVALTIDGDVLDALCWRHYGREDAVPAVLAANPGLASKGAVLPAGVPVVLPELASPAPGRVVRLWDAPADAADEK